jgi:hypothetical protein
MFDISNLNHLVAASFCFVTLSVLFFIFVILPKSAQKPDAKPEKLKLLRTIMLVESVVFVLIAAGLYYFQPLPHVVAH